MFKLKDYDSFVDAAINPNAYNVFLMINNWVRLNIGKHPKLYHIEDIDNYVILNPGFDDFGIGDIEHSMRKLLEIKPIVPSAYYLTIYFSYNDDISIPLYHINLGFTDGVIHIQEVKTHYLTERDVKRISDSILKSNLKSFLDI